MKIEKEDLLQLFNFALEIKNIELEMKSLEKDSEIKNLQRQMFINGLYSRYGLDASDVIDAEGNVIKQKEEEEENVQHKTDG